MARRLRRFEHPRRRLTRRVRAVRAGGAVALLSLVLAGCSGPRNMLDTYGQGAREAADIWWLMFWLGTAVFIVVIGLLLFAIFHGRRDRSAAMSQQGRHRTVILGGIVIPVIIIAVVYAYSTSNLLSRAEVRNAEADVVIDVVAHQFWWEVRYPNDDVVTANEIHIPVNQSVEFRLTSVDVIHSFWIPQLHGKLDMMPGKTTRVVVEAEEPGTYRGQCAQYCGVQHANMALLVIVEEEDGYQEWLAHQARPAEPPVAGSLIERGRDIYMSSACVYCHTIDGTASNGTLGPDLTHLASRQTLAAGIIENNPGNLAGWILDPQQIKPGNAMPAVELTGEELQALLEYLNSLD
jgi:cytochrome c oxidase subunit II